MENPAPLLIDVQRGFDDSVWGARNNATAEANIVRLLAAWRDAGLPAIHIQHTSVRMAANLGFTVTLVGDATATFDRSDVAGAVVPADEIHRVHLASLHNEFCSVRTTEMVIGSVA